MEGWVEGVERKDQDQDEWIRWIPMDWVGGETGSSFSEQVQEGRLFWFLLFWLFTPL